MEFINIMDLPDPLTYADGSHVKSAQEWIERRRSQVLELFRTHVYGRTPPFLQSDLFFKARATEGALSGNADLTKVDISFKGPGGVGRFTLHLIVPTASAKPVPTFLCIGHRDYHAADLIENQSEFFPISRLIDRGYAAAIFNVNEIAPDNNDTFDTGVRSVCNTPRTPESWGALAAWAWACSRAMDYFETDHRIDSSNVAVVGHSRGGKAALWCGAEDQRYKLVVSNESGCSGAAITRGKQGEQISNITGVFPYWFCENYRNYANNTQALPVDQHELIALIAPRPVYVCSATEDTWSDPHNEFLGCVHAEAVYNLFDLQGISTSQMPPPETPLQTGTIAYHLRTGRHDLTTYDWNQFLNFADKPGVLK